MDAARCNYLAVSLWLILANKNLGSFLALYADVETVGGIGYAYTLQVVVYHGSVSVLGDDVGYGG